jgi:hypothetical protein
MESLPLGLQPIRQEAYLAVKKTPPDRSSGVLFGTLEQFQEKRTAAFHPELRKNKELEQVGDSIECRTALTA